jgi:hypothetical protein
LRTARRYRLAAHGALTPQLLLLQLVGPVSPSFGRYGSEPVSEDVGDLPLDLITTEVLDGRLGALDYRPAA